MGKKVEITCISCPMGCDVELEIDDNDQIECMEGATCKAGEKYVKNEYYNPTRILPTTARVNNGVLPLVPVKSKDPLPKELLEKAMKEIAKVQLDAPVKLGDVVVKNILDTGVDIVATRDMPKGI
jgi:CxxC motif-containing protein